MNLLLTVFVRYSIRWARRAVAIILVFVLGFAITPVEAADSVTWKFSIWGNPRAFTAGIEQIKKYVEDKSGGKFKIDIFYGEALSKANQNLDGIAIGAFESSCACAGYYPKKTPTLLAPSLPFMGLDDLDLAQEVFEEYIRHPAVVKDLERWNAKILMTAILPRQEFFGNGPPPLKISDWKGMPVTTIGTASKAMRKLGAVPVGVTAPEIYTLLSRGTVRAAINAFSYAFEAYKWDEVTNWYTSNMALTTSSCHIIVGLKAWNKLPPKYQKLLEESVASAYDALKKAYVSVDERYIPALEKKGFTKIVYTDEQLTEIQRLAGDPVWKEWIEDATKDGVPAQELVDFLLTTIAEKKKM